MTVAVAGCVLLLARPLAARVADDPTLLWVALFVGLGAVGAWWPLTGPAAADGSRASPAAVLALGLAVFVMGRWLGGARPPAAATVSVVVLNSLAAVAEEAFFRRLVYGLLVGRGEAVAVVGSAVAFAVVHVSVWGMWVLPLDLAAGLMLSWQRWASGRWWVPAATHVGANILAVA